MTLPQALADYERELIRVALYIHGGKKAKTAASLGITREGLWKKMRRLGLA